MKIPFFLFCFKHVTMFFFRWNGLNGNEPNGSHVGRIRWYGQKINSKHQNHRRWAFKKTKYGLHRRWQKGPGSGGPFLWHLHSGQKSHHWQFCRHWTKWIREGHCLPKRYIESTMLFLFWLKYVDKTMLQFFIMKDIGGMLLLPGKNKTITVSQGEPLLNLKKYCIGKNSG